MQKHVNLVDLVKSFPTNIFLQNLASMQKRTSPIKFAHLAEKSENDSISNLSTKERTPQPWSRASQRVGTLFSFLSFVETYSVGAHTVQMNAYEHVPRRNLHLHLPRYEDRRASGDAADPTQPPAAARSSQRGGRRDASALSKLNSWRLPKLIKIK